MFRIQLARQGQTMEQGTLVRWIKQEGEDFEIGKDLYEIETEKALVAIQATRPGRLVKLLAAPGDTLPLGALLAIAADPDEQVSTPQIDALISQDTKDESSVQPAPANEVLAEPVATRAPDAVQAIPKARVLAKELGVELSTVKSSGAGGVITPDDVRRAARDRANAAGQVATSEQAATATLADPRITRRTALSPIGRSMIAALERAWRVPQFTQGILVDASELVRRRREAGDTLSYMDFFLDALVHAARQVPDVLARASDRELHYFGTVDVSIATATDHGLLLAVLRDAGATTVSERGLAWRSLVDRARSGRLAHHEATGGVIALSNLGTRGVEYGTALLPADHAAIAFFGSLEVRAIAVGGRVEARPTLHVSVTYDHRVVDGVLGARFTTAIKSALERPAEGGAPAA